MFSRNANAVIKLDTEARSETDADWDRFVTDAAGGTFCHLGAWREVMTDVLGHECIYVGAKDDNGALHGVLPLVAVRSFAFGHFLVSMPFLNYGGPLGSRPARRKLAEWAAREAERRGVDLLELRTRAGASGDGPWTGPEAGPASNDHGASHATPGSLGFEDFTVSNRKVTVLLPLPDDPEVLWTDGLKAKVRSQVRRPIKEGFEVRFGSDQVEPFYEVFAQNMRDLGTPVLPRALFERLPGAFGEAVVFGVVYDGDRPIAAGCGFHFGGEFELTWASSLRAYNRQAPNMLLYWRLMEDAIRRGASIFNFGRCTPGGGTHRFKLQWGGSDEPLPWAQWPDAPGASTPSPDQGKYKLATRLWSRLPVPLTRWVGPPIARRIP